MYESLGRQRGYKLAAGVHVRQIPVDAHRGNHRDFLRRHEQATRNAASGTRKQRREYATCLLARAADERNLKCAIEHLIQDGNKSPGPNKLRLERLEPYEHWNLARTLSAAILNESYRPQPARRIDIPKTSGTGTRPLDIPNAEDKIVQRAIVQAVQPLLDPRFDKMSFGYRPGLSREHALATAKLLTVQQGHGTWITEDLQDAFTRVPHRRLLDVLRKAELPEDLLRLIMRVIHNPQRRGIPQGACLSPLLLNAYLDFHVDRTWRRKHPKTPLIRVADDLLIMCQDTLQAQQAYSDLDRLIKPIGMRLKHGEQKAICRLREGEQAQWLGYQISLSQDSQDIAVRVGEPCWDRLTEKLHLLHESPQAALRASDVVYGWVGQLGPCLGYVTPKEVYARIVSVGRIAGFEEVPAWDDLLRQWEQAQARFTSLETDTRLMVSTGFALAPPNGFVFSPA